MKTTFLVLMIAIVVTGCHSKPKKIPKVTRVVSGTTVPRREAPRVRSYEIVEEYGLGRRIDPNNPNIMYGPCKMYVIKRSPTWNLAPHGPVTKKPFKERIHPLKVKFENMKKEQALIDERNKTTGQIGLELLRIRRELQKTNSKKVKRVLSTELKKLNKTQGKVKRRMAELEQ